MFLTPLGPYSSSLLDYFLERDLPSLMRTSKAWRNSVKNNDRFWFKRLQEKHGLFPSREDIQQLFPIKAQFKDVYYDLYKILIQGVPIATYSKRTLTLEKTKRHLVLSDKRPLVVLSSSFLITSSRPREAHVWEKNRGKWRITTALKGHEGQITALSVNSEKTIVSGCDKGIVHIWKNIAPKKWIIDHTIKKKHPIYTLVQTNFHTLIGTKGVDVWEKNEKTNTWSCIATLATLYSNTIRLFAVSATNSLMVINTLIWEKTESGKWRWVDIMNYVFAVTAVCIAPKEDLIAVGQWSSECAKVSVVDIWEKNPLTTHWEKTCRLKSPTGHVCIRSIAIDATSTFIYSLDYQGRVDCWKKRSASPFFLPKKRTSWQDSGIAIDVEGRFLETGPSREETVHVIPDIPLADSFKPVEPTWKRILHFNDYGQNISEIAFDPKGVFFAVHYYDYKTKIFSLNLRLLRPISRVPLSLFKNVYSYLEKKERASVKLVSTRFARL